MDLLLTVKLKVMSVFVKGWGWLSVEQFGVPAWGTSSFKQGNLGMSSEKLVVNRHQSLSSKSFPSPP